MENTKSKKEVAMFFKPAIKEVMKLEDPAIPTVQKLGC